jgi:uncharacterized membrane protein YdjX (TVP38/TMEM64 family)
MFTFDNLKQNRDFLVTFVREHYELSVCLFIALYIVTTAFSIPGDVILTLAGGFLFGVIVTIVIVNAGATAGATLAFLSARYLIGDRLQERYQIRLAKFNDELGLNGTRYLLTLRFIPVIPFILINFLSGLTKIPLKTFIWTTSVGIIPGTVVYAYAGRQIGSVNSLPEVFSRNVIIAFAVLAIFAISPVILNRIRSLKQAGLHVK